MIVMPDGANDPYQGIVAATFDAPLPKGTCKGVMCGTAGTLNGIDEMGVAFSGYPLIAGYNKIRLIQMTTGGSAANLWALY